MTHWRWTVPPGVPAVRADLAILGAMKAGEGHWSGKKVECSRSRIQTLMLEGRVKVGKESLIPRAKVRQGAVVEIEFPAPTPLELVPEDRALEILFEDSHLLVINKPPGLTVHPSATQRENTLVHALLFHIQDLSGIGGKLRPGIVHRIDKDTSGALVITKSDAAHRALVETFSKHEIERSYWAICYGSPFEPTGRIESFIGRNPVDRKKMSMKVQSGRRAVTLYTKLEEYGRPAQKPFASLIEARLETGRTHQIRVHFTGIGHSIVGDPVYGTPSTKQPKWLALPPDVRESLASLKGQALHARVLGFVHPITHEKLHFEAEPPAEFQALLGILRKYK